MLKIVAASNVKQAWRLKSQIKISQSFDNTSNICTTTACRHPSSPLAPICAHGTLCPPACLQSTVLLDDIMAYWQCATVILYTQCILPFGLPATTFRHPSISQLALVMLSTHCILPFDLPATASTHPSSPRLRFCAHNAYCPSCFQF